MGLCTCTLREPRRNFEIEISAVVSECDWDTWFMLVMHGTAIQD